MKKSISILLSLVLSFVTITMHYLKTNNSSQNNLVYAQDLDCNGFEDFFDNGDEEEYSSVDEIIEDMSRYYNILLDDPISDYYMSGYIDNSNSFTADQDESAYFEIYYSTILDFNLTITNNDNKTETYNIKIFTNSEKFSGNIAINGNEVNIFDLETDYPNEFPPEDTELYSLNNLRFALSLSILTARVIKFAVIATVVIICTTYPIYYVGGLQSLGKTIENEVSVIFEKVRYTFTKLIDECRELVKTNKDNNNNNIYYLAIPITGNNVDVYKKKYGRSSINEGDMLISQFPVSETVAKKMINKGYSVYTYYESDAEYILSQSFKKGFVEKDICDDEEFGYYSHFHPYYIASNGKKHKRQGYIDGVKINIHGFFADPIG